MTITSEQGAWARVAGITFLAKFVLETFGDTVTILARRGMSFTAIAGYAAAHDVLWRFSLLNVGLAWILICIQGYALYVVLEPVSRRLAQLALVLRLGASFVGAASLMFRFAQARLYQAVATEGLFTTEQLRTLAAVAQRGTNGGVATAWLCLGAGSTIFYLLFQRSRYLPRALAGLGTITCALLIAMAAATLEFPQRAGDLKLLGVPSLLVDITTAVWLVTRGLQPRATAEA